jgi:hypothetical protein
MLVTRQREKVEVPLSPAAFLLEAKQVTGMKGIKPKQQDFRWS